MTLDDLYEFFSTKKKSMSFSAEKSGYQLQVSVPAMFAEQDDDDESNPLMFAHIKLFHIDRNRNNSNVTREAAEGCLDTIKYKPVLAHIIQNEDGEEDFGAHDFEENDDGSITYLERQVGSFTADEPEIRYDEEEKHDFVFAKCAIPREYTHTCDIIKRRGGTDVSVELLINACSYNAKEKCLDLTDVEVSGCTLLGSSVEPGMKGAKLQLKDFAATKDDAEMFSEDKMMQLMSTLESISNKLSDLNFRKEDGEMPNDDPTKVTNAENQSNLDTESQTDNSTAETTATVTESQEDVNTNNSEETTTTETESVEDGENKETKSAETTETESTETEEAEKTEESGEDTKTYSRTYERDGNKVTVSYEVSHEDVRNALMNLIVPYEEDDNDWYFINSVFDDHFIFEGYFTSQIWGQKYSVDGDNVSLSGDRYKLHAEYLTDDEEAALNDMRANYSAIKESLAKYQAAELKAEKEAILANEKYAEYLNTAEFKAITDNLDEIGLDDLKTRCELAFAAQFNGKKDFAAEKPKDKAPKTMFAFARQTEEKNSFLEGLKNAVSSK